MMGVFVVESSFLLFERLNAETPDLGESGTGFLLKTKAPVPFAGYGGDVAKGGVLERASFGLMDRILA
jgi:hypothetical protein